MSGADYCCERRCLRSPRTVVDGPLRCGCFSWCKCSCAKNLAVNLSASVGNRQFLMLHPSPFASSLKRAPLISVAQRDTSSVHQQPSAAHTGQDIGATSARSSTVQTIQSIGSVGSDDNGNNNMCEREIKEEDDVTNNKTTAGKVKDSCGEQTTSEPWPRPFPRRRQPYWTTNKGEGTHGQRRVDGLVDNEGYCSVPVDVPLTSKSSPSSPSVCRVYDRKPETDVVYRGVRCRCGLWLNNSSPLVFVSPCGHNFCVTCANMFDRCFTCHALITGRVSTTVERII